MHDRERTPMDLLEWRVTELEIIHKGMQVELHDLRTEQRAHLRQDYMTVPEMRNTFVTREELRDQARTRREWPLIFAGVIVAAVTVANFIITLRGGR